MTAIRAMYATERTATAPPAREMGEKGRRSRELRIGKDGCGGINLRTNGRTFKDPQFGAPRAAIMKDFGAGRHDRLLGKERPQPRLYGVAERILHEAVLNAMERDAREPSAGGERF